MNSDLRQRVRAFLLTNFYVPEDEPLRDEDSLLERGIVDSTGVLEVVSFLEGELGVEVADEDVVPDNFGSIAALAAYVERKRSS